jgi:hypothetical protein
MSDRVEEYQDAFARIEREVGGGNTDLSGLGFWRLVRSVKADPRLAHHWAEEVGRIDRKAFEARVRPRFPVAVGNAVLAVAGAVLVAFVPLAVSLARRDPEGVLPGLMVVASGGGLGAALHDLGHWAVGRMAGIRFTSYFLDGPLQVQPGLKIDYASYLRASPEGRAWMHAAGALVTKAAPFAVFAAAYLPHRASGYVLFPAWALWGVLAVGALQIFTDLTFSRKKSDWKKVRRERLVARVQAAPGRR